MHPNEMKNRALVAAVAADWEGFTATAEALLRLAVACATEAKDIDTGRHKQGSPGQEGARQDECLLIDTVR